MAFRWAPGEPQRHALFPIRHPDIWAFRKKLQSLHWTAQEVDLTDDHTDWAKLSPAERHLVTMQLAFFARADIDILDNLDENFGTEVDCLEAKFVYATQKEQECTHTESYNLQIDAVMTEAEATAAKNAVERLPVIGRMRRWVRRWFDRQRPLGERLVAFALVEGVMFSASFAVLQWMRENDRLKGITEYNTFIARDEGLHTLFACLLIRVYLIVRPELQRVRQVVDELVAVMDEFVAESLPGRLPDGLPGGVAGITARQMKEYVRFQADCVVADMGYLGAYGAGNPFPFMDKLSLNEVAKTNFFERRPSQYQGVTTEGAARLTLDDTPVQ